MSRLLLLFCLFSFTQHVYAFQADFIKGVSMPLHVTDGSCDYTSLIHSIKKMNANWISINIKFYQQKNEDNVILIPEPDDPYWELFRTTIQEAKDQGLKVLVLPFVYLKEPTAKQWRGTINPSNVDEWFGYYFHLMEIIASVCEDQNVEMLSVGSELTSLQGQELKWNLLIQHMRSYYGGLISYSVNWDAIHKFPFVEKLDVVGISSYFPLTKLHNHNPSQAELNQKWVDKRKEILSHTTLWEKPFYFSELGYRSVDGVASRPYEYSYEDALDLEEQRMCFEAFSTVWNEDDQLDGVFIYEVYEPKQFPDKGYSVNGKPAEKVVLEFFKSKD